MHQIYRWIARVECVCYCASYRSSHPQVRLYTLVFGTESEVVAIIKIVVFVVWLKTPHCEPASCSSRYWDWVVLSSIYLYPSLTNVNTGWLYRIIVYEVNERIRLVVLCFNVENWFVAHNTFYVETSTNAAVAISFIVKTYQIVFTCDIEIVYDIKIRQLERVAVINFLVRWFDVYVACNSSLVLQKFKSCPEILSSKDWIVKRWTPCIWR